MGGNEEHIVKGEGFADQLHSDSPNKKGAGPLRPSPMVQGIPHYTEADMNFPVSFDVADALL
ncbi:hypothetical protein ANFP_15890 [Acidithiobacillus ferrooxidans]|nr:hypothetical protein ANFP_15890 [Acidithiobacillus ferrooxidans]